MAIQHSSSFDGLSLQAENELLRFPASSFGKYLEQAREEADVIRDTFIEAVNEIIATKNVHLPAKNQIELLNTRVYGNLERNERHLLFEEIEPLYQAFSKLLTEPFSNRERERYYVLAQTRFNERKRRPKKGYAPTTQDWQDLYTKLAAIDTHRASGRALQKSKTPYLLPVPSPSTPQIRLSAKVVNLLNFDTGHVIERDNYIENMMHLWDEGKRLVITRAISGSGKTRAFYLLLKRIARLQNHWPFYYALSSSGQTPDDHLDSLLSLFYTDLQLSSPEDTHLSREERMEQIFAELARCSAQGLRLAVLIDDAHLLLDPSGTLSAAWQHFFDQWIAHEHTSVLCLATREWPHWRGRDRSFIKEFDLEPLSPEGGATIWKRFGFDDVPDTLLREASRKCGGYPQWIELRASDLDQPGHQFLWPRADRTTFTRQSIDNQHTKRIKTWLEEETIFDTFTDVGASEELTQIFTRELPYEVQQILDLLAASPLGIPFPLLQQEFDRPELALDELMRLSLVDRDSFELGRAALVSLVREARLHQLPKEQKEQIEQRVTVLYTSWLYDLQSYQDDMEQAALITELIVLYIKKQQFLKAVELLATFGWLCAQLGHMHRIERYTKIVRTIPDATPEREAGKLLLHYQIASLTGQKIDGKERYAIYQNIHTIVLAKEINLPPHTEVMITHFLATPLLRAGHFKEAQELFEATIQRISQQFVPPEVYAAFLHSKTNLFETWSKSKDVKGDTKQIIYLQEQCVATLIEAVECWRICLQNALPLTQTYVKFKLARTLNDLALNLRLIGRIPEAEQAIVECIELKGEREKKEGTLSQSYGISLGEYAQVLAAQGKFERSHDLNREAQVIMDKHIEQGNSRARSNKGMLLVERAYICFQQANLSEAKRCLVAALELLEETTSREEYIEQATNLLTRIEPWLYPSSTHYLLDQHWFERYHQLAGYDDLEMLVQAGTFTVDEQREWDILFSHRSEQEAQTKLKEIIANSKEREFERCLTEGSCAPHLTYPLIDIDDIVSRIARFETLRTEIETQESHAIVRHIYLERIDEHLHGLRLLEAVYDQKAEQIREHNEWLYGKPTLDEMSIALAEFSKMLQRARNHPEAYTLRQEIIAQLEQWHISVDDFVREEQESLKKKSSRRPELTQKGISPSALQHILEGVLNEYHFSNWQIIPSPERENFAVEPDKCTIAIPTRKLYSPLQALELVAEEIEIHAFRPEAGKRSPLALLGSGTRKYLVLDEGLAVHYIRQVREMQGLGERSYSYVQTLILGMVTGVMFPALGFEEVFSFLKQAFSMSHLLAGKCSTQIEAEKEAARDALKQLIRIYRGVPDMAHTIATCNLKDRIYLQGEIEVTKIRETMSLERMFVGAVGVEQLEDMTELGIQKPAIPHLQLACKPELLTQLINLTYKKGD